MLAGSNSSARRVVVLQVLDAAVVDGARALGDAALVELAELLASSPSSRSGRGRSPQMIECALTPSATPGLAHDHERRHARVRRAVRSRHRPAAQRHLPVEELGRQRTSRRFAVDHRGPLLTGFAADRRDRARGRAARRPPSRRRRRRRTRRAASPRAGSARARRRRRGARGACTATRCASAAACSRSCSATTSVDAALAVGAREQRRAPPTVAQVERGGRLVEQQDLRLLREHHREPGAAALAARERLDARGAQVGEAHRRERAAHRARGRSAPSGANTPRWGWRPGAHERLDREPLRDRRAPAAGAPRGARTRGARCGARRRRRAHAAAARRELARRAPRAACDLPEPFGPTQRHDLARADRERDVAHRRRARRRTWRSVHALGASSSARSRELPAQQREEVRARRSARAARRRAARAAPRRVRAAVSASSTSSAPPSAQSGSSAR